MSPASKTRADRAINGLGGRAAIVGMVELAPEKLSVARPTLSLEQWAALAKTAVDDAGLRPEDIDGICTTAIAESTKFVPATVAEYLGLKVDFAEFVDLGGATAAGMIWRAAAAIELGIADVVLCCTPGQPTPSSRTGKAQGLLAPDAKRGSVGASSTLFGSAQAEFELPYGLAAQNAPYAMIAQRYDAEYGLDRSALSKIAVDQRTNANSYETAIFHDKPITLETVNASPMVAEPLRMLDMVMPVSGGAAVVVASEAVAARSRNRPVWIRGFGERLTSKSPAFVEDLLDTPIRQAADRAFEMAGRARTDVDMVSIYDCYTITVLMSLEDAGFVPKGKGGEFVLGHDLTFKGDFPCNTVGGQLSFGQAHVAGGMHHVCDAVRQISARAGSNQIDDCNIAFVSGNGGIMSEQVALVLEGD
ncbi:thiolase family protein [Rhodococcus sp. DMU1]|uniref:thiolase family protein n=1 Tax=Rhodococcus sp. DMU1 TaxID=2722825 RepID=UPI00143E8E5D|nr:thiolase family protein [Rhodococcus sp. DMU1]QIX53623.1 thiolase family protein [Rhodococcus sp. DMU1]